MMIDFDQGRLAAAGLSVELGVDMVILTKDRITARVRVIGDQLHFLPDRSAAHKAVLTALQTIRE